MPSTVLSTRSFFLSNAALPLSLRFFSLGGASRLTGWGGFGCGDAARSLGAHFFFSWKRLDRFSVFQLFQDALATSLSLSFSKESEEREGRGKGGR